MVILRMRHFWRLPKRQQRQAGSISAGFRLGNRKRLQRLEWMEGQSSGAEFSVFEMINWRGDLRLVKDHQVEAAEVFRLGQIQMLPQDISTLTVWRPWLGSTTGRILGCQVSFCREWRPVSQSRFRVPVELHHSVSGNSVSNLLSASLLLCHKTTVIRSPLKELAATKATFFYDSP